MDLSGYQEIMKSSADLIPDLDDLSTQQLADNYLNCEKDWLKDSYIAALCLRYWNRIYLYYQRSMSLRVSLEDTYDWLLECVQYSLEICPWAIEGNPLYKDPNGFDKVLNRCLSCARANAYQASNRKKRKAGHFICSLDEVIEDSGEFAGNVSLVDSSSFIDSVNDFELSILIKQLFESKDYLKCFIIFAIIHYGADTPKKIRRFLMSSNKHVVEFSNLYEIPIQEVARAYTYIEDLKYNDILKRILMQLKELKLVLKEYLGQNE